ncbi:epoxyqueuosine reductase [Chloroflexota bacterium]
MLSPKAKEDFKNNPAQFIEQEINAFARTSPANRLPSIQNYFIFNEPLVKFANGSDPIFTEYKTIIAPTHLTPQEALAKAYNRSLGDMTTRLSVISWILPITAKTRESNRRHTLTPSRLWSHTYFYGEKFNEALRIRMVELLKDMGYLAVAPMLQPYFQRYTNEKGLYSNWSERHIAYTAGQGTFGLSDGFITDRGIAHRCGSVVANVVLPVSARAVENPYSNCLFYVDATCKACIARCPAGAITERGHDKIKCQAYMGNYRSRLLREYDLEEYGARGVGCGLCQVKMPCEFQNPTRKLKRKV